MKSPNNPIALYTCFLWSALAGVAADAAAPLGSNFSYQGQLKQHGVPVNEVCDFEFRLWSDEVGGSQVAAAQPVFDVSVVNGLFQVQLDFGVAAFVDSERWLDVAVSCPAGGSLVGISPRQPITAAPFALLALDVAMVSDGALTGTYTQPLALTHAANAFSGTFNGTHSGSGAGLISLNASNVSSGTLADARLSANVLFVGGTQTITGAKSFSLAPSFTAGGAPFAVSNTTKVTNLNADLLDGLDSTAFLQSVPVPLSVSGSDGGFIFRAENASAAVSAAAVSGVSTALSGSTRGVFGLSRSVAGVGVLGLADAATGSSFGVYGQSNSTNGVGVRGHADGASGGTSGVEGTSNSPDGRGVRGIATASSGANYGVFASSASTSGRGIHGWASADSGSTVGVEGRVSSPDGYAAYFTGPAGSRNYFERNVGIGTESPAWPLHVVQPSISNDTRAIHGHASGSSNVNFGVYGETDSLFGRGVQGVAKSTSGPAVGVIGQSESISGTGVLGHALASSGTTVGVRGLASSSEGRGVFGLAQALTGTTYGVFGETSSTSGRGVHGLAAANSGTTYGVHGQSNSPLGLGVYGTATASTGLTRGVQGHTSSVSGTGVFGVATAGGNASTFGVWGQVGSTLGTGVRGQALSNTGSTVGVLGEVNSADGFAGYFAGPAGSRNYFERSVGIGTTAPSVLLQVVGGTDAGPAGGGYIQAGNTNGANVVIDENEVMARNNGVASALFLNQDGGSVIIGGNSVNSIRVGVNTNSPGSFHLAVAGDAAKNGGGSWAVFSDARLKRNIRPLTNTLDRLLTLRGYEFEFTPAAVEKGMVLPGRQNGLIAQEVEQVFPDWVGEDADGYKYVTERGVVALVVEAMRELRHESALGTEVLRAEKDAEIAELRLEYEQRINQLQGAYDSLLRENDAILARLSAIEIGMTRTPPQAR